MRAMSVAALVALGGCGDMWVDGHGCEYCECFDDGSCEPGLECLGGRCEPPIPSVWEVWEDSTSGGLLAWQNPTDRDGYFYDPAGYIYRGKWGDALAYCDALELDGHQDWRLPTISELRSLVRGCPDNETGGACGVTDSCLGSACYHDCGQCGYDAGPGAEGCYWDLDLTGRCTMYWSSSTNADNIDWAWMVDFESGDVSGNGKSAEIRVRCVR